MPEKMSTQYVHLGVVNNGEECYSSAMENSRKVLRAFTEKWLQCVGNLLKTEKGNSRPICIAEFGAADGGVSLELMETAIDKVNKMTSGRREIILVYEDQLLNDFNVLFRTVHAKNSKIPTQFTASENVHVLASATSMYRKCLPTGFIDLAFSSMSNHWLSQRPCHIRGGIFQIDCDKEELEAFRQQWQSDWKLFLSCRAKELRPGGYMMVISFVIGDKGRFSDVGEDLHDVYTSTWKEFWQSGKITEEEFVNSSGVLYVPTKAELVQPFQNDMEGCLSLIDCTQKDVEILPGVARGADAEDRQSFVNKYLRCANAWLYNILKSGLAPGRTEVEKSKLLSEYFQTLHNILMQKTSFNPLFYKTANLLVKRLEH